MVSSPKTNPKTLSDCSVCIALYSVRCGRGLLFCVWQNLPNLLLFLALDGFRGVI